MKKDWILLIEAAVEFVTTGVEKRAIITSLDKVLLGIKGRAGTIISEK